MSTAEKQRVVITGLGPVCPIGITTEQVWHALANQNSGVRRLEFLPVDEIPSPFGGEVWDFTGEIEQFGPLERSQQRSIKKGMRVMCREIQMGVAAAQLALQDSGLDLDTVPSEKIGAVYGCDYIQSLPDDYLDGVKKCLDEEGQFDYDKWAEQGLPQMNPLWLLKYLPNMPASHIAIYNDLRGPNNSITMREPGANLAVAEAYYTILRGQADQMLAGATGSRIHPLTSAHAWNQEQVAGPELTAETAARPFDQDRAGMVLGEGAGCLVLECLQAAEIRGATIYGEILGFGSSTVIEPDGNPRTDLAVANVARQALASAGLEAGDVGHIHAHGLSTTREDALESAGIEAVFAGFDVPVVAAKSYFGNLGAGSGIVELITSLLAFQNDCLFPVLNYQTPDDNCPVNVVTDNSTKPGNTVLNINFSPQGQASSLLVGRPNS
jgi:3-oxoacyl-[acyl-carrier-protein] synthase II